MFLLMISFKFYHAARYLRDNSIGNDTSNMKYVRVWVVEEVVIGNNIIMLCKI